MRSNETKQATRQDGLDPSTEPTARGRAKDMRGAPLAPLPSVGQCRRGIYTAVRQTLSYVHSRSRSQSETTNAYHT